MRAFLKIPLLLIVLLGTPPAQTRTNGEQVCGTLGLGKLQLTKADTTILGLTIGSASLENVRARLGRARILPSPGSGPLTPTICYVSPSDGTVLTFGTGAMGGFADVTDFGIWSREAKFPNVSACRTSKWVSRSISTASGIRLGLSVEALSNIIGAQPGAEHGSVHYEMNCRRKMTLTEIKGFKTVNNWDVSSDPYFDLDSSVDARVSNSVVIRIEITKIESY